MKEILYSTIRIHRKAGSLLILFIMILTGSCDNGKKQNPDSIGNAADWWVPIIQKHKIDLNQFNYKATFNCINENNLPINKWLELGNDDGSDDKYLKLKDVVIIVLFDTTLLKSSNQNYWILSTPKIQYDKEKKTVDYDWGRTSWFDINTIDTVPLNTFQGYGKFDFNSDIKLIPESYKTISH